MQTVEARWYLMSGIFCREFSTTACRDLRQAAFSVSANAAWFYFLPVTWYLVKHYIKENL